MNSFDDYENDLDAIRISLYEQTKNMTSEEHTSFFNDKAQSIAKKCGFKLIKEHTPHAAQSNRRLMANVLSDCLTKKSVHCPA
ncbi:MAG: hypothetical protein LBV65_02130 [Desulfovibrio sp.]|jgi:hypothetical protein|nr:hypothetical protein [Desulfovibrio sp.]